MPSKKSKDCNLIESYKITNKPEIGIFITYTDSGRCLVNTDGDKWSVEPNHLRIYEVKYDKVSSNRKSLY